MHPAHAHDGCLTQGEKAKTVPVTAHQAQAVNDANWNLIGNPYLCNYQAFDDNNLAIGKLDKIRINGTWRGAWKREGEQRYVVTTQDNFRSYDQDLATHATLRAFTSFFVQTIDLDGGASSLVFDLQASRTAMLRTPANRHSRNDDLRTTGITLTQGDKQDHTGLLTADFFTNLYDLDADLVKLFGQAQGLALYSLSGDEKRAFQANNTLFDDPVPVGFSGAQTDSELVIAFDNERYASADIVALWLHDNITGITTDLLADDYHFTTTVETDDTRFTLQPQYATVVTGLENMTTNAAGITAVYDIMGRQIDITVNRRKAMQTLPRGAYIVIDNGKARKIVVM